MTISMLLAVMYHPQTRIYLPYYLLLLLISWQPINQPFPLVYSIPVVSHFYQLLKIYNRYVNTAAYISILLKIGAVMCFRFFELAQYCKYISSSRPAWYMFFRSCVQTVSLGAAKCNSTCINYKLVCKGLTV